MRTIQAQKEITEMKITFKKQIELLVHRRKMYTVVRKDEMK